MNLPSRGLRPSATTMRNTGAFFAPTLFMRILTAINQRFSRRRPHGRREPPGFPKRKRETSLAPTAWQVLFFRFFDTECILILPPERGHSCPQRAPSAHRFTYVLKPFLPRTLLRTGMSALRTGGSIKMHPGKRELAALA